MAKKTPAKKPAAAAAPKSKVVATTPVRNTPIPKVSAAPAAKKSIQITHEMIAVRAYEIHVGGTGGSESDNWHRAERELRTGL